MALFKGVQHLCTFNIVASFYLSDFFKCLEGVYTTTASIFIDVPYWPSCSTDESISCVVPHPSLWFFHFGEEIVIAWTQEKTTTPGGTEPHYSSRQWKESHHCCHGPLAPLAMGESGTSSVLTRYESMWLRSLRQSEKKPCKGSGTTQEKNLSVQ